MYTERKTAPVDGARLLKEWNERSWSQLRVDVEEHYSQEEQDDDEKTGY
jgi:hypothetical protein